MVKSGKPNVQHLIKTYLKCAAIEYYSTMKRNEALINATTLMNLENIMLSKRSQSQSTTYCMIPLV